MHFADAKTLIFRGQHIAQKDKPLHEIMDYNIKLSAEREYFFKLLMMFVAVISKKNIRGIIENPWNTSGMTFLENNFIPPTVIDNNRMLRGDWFTKPTAYWFINCVNTYGYSSQKDKERKVIMKCKRPKGNGICSTERSAVSPDYARNFICDFILGKAQGHTIPTLF